MSQQPSQDGAVMKARGRSGGWQTVAELLPSPRNRRIVEGLLMDLAAHRVALLLGAGVDRALSGAAGWNELVHGLFPSGSQPPTELLSGWVTELAAAARQYHGDVEFFRAVRDATDRAPRKTDLRTALAGFARQVPLVVTTNYSKIVAAALYRGKPPVLVDRSTLRSARLPEPGVRTKRPTLVHIHGRDHESVLDKLAYDEAEHLDLLYRDFLSQVFERWTVLAIGFSFSDIPFRAAAALAQTRRPELRRVHVWFDRRSESGRFHWHCRASRLCYSVARVEVSDHVEVARLAKAVSAAKPPDLAEARGAVEGAKADGFSGLARILDSAGDYETELHRNLFGMPGKAKGARELAGAMISDPPSTMVLARIERHLRHHLYFLQDRTIAGNLRRELWGRLVSRVRAEPDAARRIREEPQLHFDLLLGGLEVSTVDAYLELRGLLGMPATDLFEQRLLKVVQVWKPAPADKTPSVLAELRRWACDVGWESIEAKLALEEARAVAKQVLSGQPSKLSAAHIDRVLGACATSVRASQHAGTLQRELGSYILKSFWVPSDAEARAVLRGAVTLAQGAAPLYSTLVAAVAMAWQRTCANRDEAFAEVGWIDPPSSAELDAQWLFWRDLSPGLRREPEGK